MPFQLINLNDFKTDAKQYHIKHARILLKELTWQAFSGHSFLMNVTRLAFYIGHIESY